MLTLAAARLVRPIFISVPVNPFLPPPLPYLPLFSAPPPLPFQQSVDINDHVHFIHVLWPLICLGYHF